MRLINADSLGIGLCNPDIMIEKAYAEGWNRAVRIIQSAPTITPESLVVHAKWLINPDGYYPYCSCCREEPEGRIMTKYCPNCGCKMQEDDDGAE